MGVMAEITGDEVTRAVFSLGIGAAAVYAAYLHIRAGLMAEAVRGLWKRLVPAVFYLAAALFAANVIFAPERLVAALMPEEARRRAGELGKPEAVMAVLLVLSALAVLVYALLAPYLRRVTSRHENNSQG